MSEPEQWVNLKKDAKFVEDDVASEEVVGPVLLECKFEKASLAGFRVRIIPLGDHAKYKPGESARNENFRVRVGGTVTNSGAKETKLEKEIDLTAAGGNEYKIQAKYKKTVIESGKKLEARRRLFYQVMTMDGLSTPGTSTMDDAFWKPDKKFFIKLIKKGPAETIPHTGVIETNDSSSTENFIRAVGAKYAHKSLKPYAFVVAFVDQIADSTEITIAEEFDIAFPKRILTMGYEGQEFTLSLPRYLWYGFDANEDATKSWLVDGVLEFLPDGAKPGEAVTLTVDDCNVAGSKYRTHGGYAKIHVRIRKDALKRNWFSQKRGKLRYEFTLKTVKGFKNGIAYNVINLIAIADKASWEDQPSDVRIYTLNHEVGHKVGMVASGTGRLPEGPSTLYGENRGINDQDHAGPHCQKGATWDATKDEGKRWSGTPGCVMFGSNGISDGGALKSAPAEFCDQCEAIVRKLDLHGDTLLTTGMQISVEEF